MFNPAIYVLHWLGRQLSRRGLIDQDRGRRIADLAWPRFLTMFARSSLRVADISMIGLSIGSTAIAGLAFAAISWQVAVSFGLGIAGGTIGLVSQRFAADRFNQIDLAIKQSVWLGAVLTVPFIFLYWAVPADLIGLLTTDAAVIKYGAEYLKLTSLALLFAMFNLVASRALAGADDTWISMVIRSTGAITNIALNAVFIFGLEMGVTGAALGTLVADGLVAVCFLWGFLTGGVPLVGSFPIGISLRRPYFDLDLVTERLREQITDPDSLFLVARRGGLWNVHAGASADRDLNLSRRNPN